MLGWLARRIRIAWRLRRHAFVAGFGLVAAALTFGLTDTAGERVWPKPTLLLGLSAAILGTGLAAVALVAMAILPFLRNVLMMGWFAALAGVASVGLGGDGTLVALARLAVVFGLVVLLYILPLPVALTHRASRRLAAGPEAVRAVLTLWDERFFDPSIESVEPLAERENTFRVRYRKRGLDQVSGTLTVIEDTPRRLVTRLVTDRRAPLDVTVSVALAPEGEGTRVDYAETVHRAPAVTHAMMWLDRALLDALDDIEDAALGRPFARAGRWRRRAGGSAPEGRRCGGRCRRPAPNDCRGHPPAATGTGALAIRLAAGAAA